MIKCLYCNKLMLPKTVPLIHEFGRRDHPIIYHCCKCKKYYVNNETSISRSIEIVFVCLCIVLLFLFWYLCDLNIFMKMLFCWGLAIGLFSSGVFVKSFYSGCIVECDNNFQPIVRKSNYRMIVSTAKKRKFPYSKFNAQLKIEQLVIPILVTDIEIDADTVKVHFFLSDEYEITDKQLTLTKSFILLRKKEVFEGIICKDNF